MQKPTKNSRTVRLVLVSAVLLSVLAVSGVTADKKIHKHVHRKVAKLIYKFADAVPNEIGFIKLNKPRHFAIAFALHMAPKVIYWRLTKKYKKEHKKNEKMRKKYRTIVPVSIVPQLIYNRLYEREKNSLYYFVGPDDSHEPKIRRPEIPVPEIPDETKAAYEKAGAFEHAAAAQETTMVHDAIVKAQEIMGQASMSEGHAISQAQWKNKQSIMDVENAMKEISMNSKIENISYEGNMV